ncbi:MAG: hypothetical protein OQK94_09930 [Gammaproteobacteria bacterium]|nr:hypothetical protein [Gammaproteobacteria bacterium]MCW8839471.1 hypothetical protein [Gammaproteobacteria bacterium]MCW8959815.1 hypothetical protein [Gammaproteobacteria bacterium]MCW8971876.1 hypothetical protein [Gammaproteobacteria bacterium]MCW8994006.1 hypothetical protein [Gammaproteobacteria bacterium]
MPKVLYALPLLSLFASPLLADDIDALGSLSQAQFRALSEDLGAALSYKALSPAEPLGVTGIDVGMEVSATDIENTAAFDAACGGCGTETLVIPKLHLHKGLPASFDIGLVLGSVPGSNVKLSGVELRYALIDGGMALPAVALRASYSELSGVDELSMNSSGMELTVSKGLTMVTPYAGIGRHWINSNPAGSTGLADEEFTQDKLFAGANLNLGLMNLAFEVDRSGDSESYSAKLGFRF